MRTSTRSDVDPFIVMDIMEAARAAEAAGRHIIHMEVGQPGTGAPQAATRALTEAMKKGPLGYTVALGLPELRARIARLYGEWYDLDLNPDRVVVTSGASGGFLLAFNALFDSGDRVGIGAPGYPSYRQILRALGLQPVDLPTLDVNRLQPVPADFAGLDLAGLLVASPANPSGTMLDIVCDARFGRCNAGNWGKLYQRRDLSRYRIRGQSGQRPANQQRRLCDQLIFQVFLNDGLARGLDGGARGSRARYRAAGPEYVHLPLACQPGSGLVRDGCHARTRGQHGCVPHQPCPDA